jgi:hypothetical protein
LCLYEEVGKRQHLDPHVVLAVYVVKHWESKPLTNLPPSQFADLAVVNLYLRDIMAYQK